MDRVARELKLDRAEVRRRNLIPASKMPYKKPLKARSGAAMEYDSGDYPACQAEARAAAAILLGTSGSSGRARRAETGLGCSSELQASSPSAAPVRK